MRDEKQIKAKSKENEVEHNFARKWQTIEDKLEC